MRLDFKNTQSKTVWSASRSNRLLAAGLVTCGIASGAVLAGEYTPIGKTGGQYTFTECEKPPSPILALNPKKVGNAAVRDYNAQIAKYNGYIANVQVYMDCLTHEADRDLETYYKAVNASLEEQQVQMQDESDGLKKVLAGGPNKNRKKLVPVDVPELEGADPVSAPTIKPTADNAGDIVTFETENLDADVEADGNSIQEAETKISSEVEEKVPAIAAPVVIEPAADNLPSEGTVKDIVEDVKPDLVDIEGDLDLSKPSPSTPNLDDNLLNQPGVTFGVPDEVVKTSVQDAAETLEEETTEQN